MTSVVTSILTSLSITVKLYAKPEKTAVSTATALFQYTCVYGLFDVLMTDPGSDFKSKMVAHLTS